MPARFVRLALFLFAFPVAAAAAEKVAVKPGGAYRACMQKANSTLDMQECQKTGLAEAQARLRGAYAKAAAALPADQQAKLKTAESRWTVFRESDCEVFYGSQTGTLATVAAGQCMIDRTESRIEQLRDFHPNN